MIIPRQSASKSLYEKIFPGCRASCVSLTSPKLKLKPAPIKRDLRRSVFANCCTLLPVPTVLIIPPIKCSPLSAENQGSAIAPEAAFTAGCKLNNGLFPCTARYFSPPYPLPKNSRQRRIGNAFLKTNMQGNSLNIW